jgi:carbamoyltransferase
MAVPLWLGEKLHMRRMLTRLPEGQPAEEPLRLPEHHESHAASAFFPSPFEEAAISAMDGVGEWATTSIGVGEGNKMRLLSEIRFPHSLGLLYSAFTYYCGFKVNSGEYKLMGLAPYGEPRFEKLIRDHLIDLRDDGSYRLDLSYFNYCQGLTMTSAKFHALFGRGRGAIPRRCSTQHHMDLAASIQAVTERS